MVKNILVVVSGVALVLAGCATKSETGALAGAGTGALVGGLGWGGGGALIGGAVGAGVGGLIGYSLDQSDREKMQNRSPNTLGRIDRREQLTIDDIKKLSSAGIKDSVIIDQIHATNSVFYLSTKQIIDLKKSGVSQRVIDAMVESGAR